MTHMHLKILTMILKLHSLKLGLPIHSIRSEHSIKKHIPGSQLYLLRRSIPTLPRNWLIVNQIHNHQVLGLVKKTELQKEHFSSTETNDELRLPIATKY